MRRAIQFGVWITPFLPHNLTSLANNQFAKCNQGRENRDSNSFPNLLRPL